MDRREVIEHLLNLSAEESFLLFYRIKGVSLDLIGDKMSRSPASISIYSKRIYNEFGINSGEWNMLRALTLGPMRGLADAPTWLEWDWESIKSKLQIELGKLNTPEPVQVINVSHPPIEKRQIPAQEPISSPPPILAAQPGIWDRIKKSRLAWIIASILVMIGCCAIFALSNFYRAIAELVNPGSTETSSITRTYTISPTNTKTLPPTMTRTLTPTITFTPTITPTASITRTATNTFTPSPTEDVYFFQDFSKSTNEAAPQTDE